MELGLKGKIVLITGGASGIGEATTRTFAAENAVTVIADRDVQKGTTVAQELEEAGHAVRFIETELTDEPAVKRLITGIESEWGRLDIIINNAAVSDGAGIESGVAAFRRSLEINLVAPYAVVHHAIGLLRQGPGVIVNVGSKVADTGQGGTSGYAASKGGIKALTREWALELSGEGIRINTVVPAEVWTPQYDAWLKNHTEQPLKARREIEEMIPLERRMTTTQEIADAIVFLASHRASHITGQMIYVDGGYTHLDRAGTVDRKYL